ncbi:MAG: DUF502 domain-containing protein [Deltaproteobacteria bacterium]|nr:MAG: DUF502 domain-containing protein [Deltaproteobacteria bacterium]
MRGFIDFIKTTIVGGIVVVLPVALATLVLTQAITALGALVEPLTDDLPVKTLGGIGVATLSAILLICAICFITGLLIRTRISAIGRDWVEKRLLNRLPGYTIVKSLTQRFSGMEGVEFAPALVDLHGADTHALALLVEEHDDGNYTVFLPLAPTPTIGQVYVIPPEKVKKIDAPLGRVLNSIMQWGVESKELFPSTSGIQAPHRDESS